jgi:hypothetical protein
MEKKSRRRLNIGRRAACDRGGSGEKVDPGRAVPESGVEKQNCRTAWERRKQSVADKRP